MKRKARALVLILGGAAVGEVVARQLSFSVLRHFRVPNEAFVLARCLQAAPTVVGALLGGIALGYVAEEEEFAWSTVAFLVALLVVMFGFVLPFAFLFFPGGILWLVATAVSGVLGLLCGRRLQGGDAVA